MAELAPVLPLDEFGMQICTKCNRKLPFAEFYPNKERRLGHLRICKECTRKYIYGHRDANPDAYLDKHLRRKFGITLVEYNTLVDAQGGVCAICRQPPPDVLKRTRKQGRPVRPKLVVDHDHVTGQVRGLLCSSCNRGIGFLKDDPAIIRLALEYLER